MEELDFELSRMSGLVHAIECGAFELISLVFSFVRHTDCLFPFVLWVLNFGSTSFL